MNDAVQAIREIVSEYAQLPSDVTSVGDSDDLFELGMTSHATVNVMLALEEVFDIDFPEDLLTKETFESVTAMASVVTDLLATV